MHARLLDMLHDAADNDLHAIRHSVHVHFDRIVQEPVEQDGHTLRISLGHLLGIAHIALEIRLCMDNFHGATAQHVGWTHYQRITDLGGTGHGIGHVACRTIRRLFQVQVAQHRLKACAVFRTVDHVRCGADDGHAILLQTT